jgi:phosphoenolpyruvate-protein phosphotransferase
MQEQHIKGAGASNGKALGHTLHYTPQPLAMPDRQPGTHPAEMQLFHTARAAAQNQLAELEANIRTRYSADDAQIFMAQSVLLDDPMLEDGVRKQLEQGGQIVEVAVLNAAETLATVLRSTGDAMLAGRAADVLDVARRVLRVLLGASDNPLANLTVPVILAADDLSPSDTAELNPALVMGICLAGGGRTSHAAVLARTLNIPAVVALGADALARVVEAEQVLLDGTSGTVTLDPERATLDAYHAERAQMAAHTAEARQKARKPAHTASGTRVEIFANGGNQLSLADAFARGAEGIGLLRTEFLYLHRATPPPENEQVQLYADLFALADGHPVTVRTLDVGGDKHPRYIGFPQEANPFLGLRGVRVSLEHPDLFKTQIRALLRAAVGHRVSVMFPMIESVETLQRVNVLVAEARAALDDAGTPYAHDVPLGIMVETPAAVVLTEIMVHECDFFSIGTNDLAQYAHAADRGSPHAAPYFNDLSPAVLRLIEQTLKAAHRADKTVSICGELAGNMLALPVLVGMGVDRLSMVGGVIPQAKWVISQFNDIDLKHIALRALMIPTAQELEDYMRSVLETHGAL